MKNKIGKLGYNCENDRFGILNSMDLWETEGLHCGECLEVCIGDSWVEDRLEMTWEGTWYLNDSKIKGMALEGIQVKY
ncbi:MAG: DUF5348 domain-containing protein [Romboutsia sp.]|uniref:DUF5348 domain-containing protein n=1 Tax=Romboutsia sp. TaxID=1965302 RepID=UPI003F36983A